MNKKFKFKELFYNTNITKIFETSKIYFNFLKYFFICRFKKFYNTKITKIFEISKLFKIFFSKKTIVLVRWREPGIATALCSGKHTVHLLCRSSSIIPIRIVAIYMTDTSLLYPYSLLNQNQTDPLFKLILVDLEGVEPSSLILS